MIMPKIDLHFKRGELLPTNMQLFLKNYFSEKDFEKLVKFGGRIQISLTAPFTDRKAQNSDLVIDKNYVQQLKQDSSKADDKLKNMTKKQLIAIASYLNFPTTKKATTKEIRKTIIDFLKSSDKWDSISNR